MCVSLGAAFLLKTVEFAVGCFIRHSMWVNWCRISSMNQQQGSSTFFKAQLVATPLGFPEMLRSFLRGFPIKNPIRYMGEVVNWYTQNMISWLFQPI